MNVVRMSTLITGRLYPPENIPGIHLCQRLSRLHGHSKVSTLNRTQCLDQFPILKNTFSNLVTHNIQLTMITYLILSIHWLPFTYRNTCTPSLEFQIVFLRYAFVISRVHIDLSERTAGTRVLSCSKQRPDVSELHLGLSACSHTSIKFQIQFATLISLLRAYGKQNRCTQCFGL